MSVFGSGVLTGIFLPKEEEVRRGIMRSCIICIFARYFKYLFLYPVSYLFMLYEPFCRPTSSSSSSYGHGSYRKSLRNALVLEFLSLNWFP